METDIPASCICVPASFAVSCPVGGLQAQDLSLQVGRLSVRSCSANEKTTAVETVWLIPPAQTRERLPFNMTSLYPGGKVLCTR